MTQPDADIPRNRAHLAQVLGVNRSQVTRGAADGMPTDSISAAREWRRNHLDPAKTNLNPARALRRQPPRKAPAPVAAETRDLVARATAAMVAARTKLDEAEALDEDTIGPLGEAMCAVPEADRRSVKLLYDVADEVIHWRLMEAMEQRLMAEIREKRLTHEEGYELRCRRYFALLAGEIEVTVS